MADEPFGRQLPYVHVAPPGPGSAGLAARLGAVESRNVTHVGEAWPVFWTEARGSNVRDPDGNVYLDLTSAFGVDLLGHGHPAVRRAVEGQLDRLVHGMGDVHPPSVKVELLERLCAEAPWQGARAVLSSTGSEAVETALKTAQLATGRPGILAFEGSYHGLTLGSLSATERGHFRDPFRARLYGGVGFVPFPDPLRGGPDSGRHALERIAEALERGAPNGDPIGTVIVEPVQGRAGARVAPDGFMAGLSALAREAGALVVADEVLTGMGRCGSLLASERVGLRPDLVCLGKALGGGMPLSACLGRRDVMDAWPPSEGEAVHTSTFLGHPVGCAAGLAVFDTLAHEGVIGRAAMLGGRLVRALRAALAPQGTFVDVRGLGLLIGIELTDGQGAPRPGAGAEAARRALARGVLLLPAGAEGHVVQLMPSVGLTQSQAEVAVDEVARAVRETLA